MAQTKLIKRWLKDLRILPNIFINELEENKESSLMVNTENVRVNGKQQNPRVTDTK